MEYEPYNDTFLEEDEDIKIWRGDTDDAKRRESRKRETAENAGKHSKKPSSGRGAKKQKTTSARRKIRVKSVEKKELIIMAAAAALIIAAGFAPPLLACFLKIFLFFPSFFLDFFSFLY